jgi:hypothetical protein
MYRVGFYDHQRVGDTIGPLTANASGIAQGFLGPVAEGYCWYVERMTIWSTNTATTGLKCEIFVVRNQQLAPGFTATAGDRQGRQDLSLAAGNDVSDEVNPLFVGAGYYLVAFWSGFTVGDTVELTSQIAVHKLQLTHTQPPIQHPSEQQLLHALPQTPEG